VKKKTIKPEQIQALSDIHAHSINLVNREIYLHSHYRDSEEEEPGVDYRMATTFIKNLHILEQQGRSNILIHMHTIGGSWNDGMAMFHAIRFAKSSITMVAYAQASSMSGVLLQAANRRILIPDCEFMVHHGSIAVDANSMAAKSAIDANQRACKRMVEIFAERAVEGSYFVERGNKPGQVKRFIDRKIKDTNDWFLTPGEAVDYGFADGILGEEGFENYAEIRKRI
jgi:ATP-dependent protease ClpP protease subunit